MISPGLLLSREIIWEIQSHLIWNLTLGMALEGEMPVEGPWVDRLCGLEGVQVDIAMMRTPDGHGRVELTKFRNPEFKRGPLESSHEQFLDCGPA